jgi:hypothetical protein
MRPLKDLLPQASCKQAIQKTLLLSSIALLAACGSDSDNNLLPEGFAYEEGIEADFRSDQTYGTDERNVYDIFLPESEEATPLVIFVHGGGFFAGDKSQAYIAPADINDFLEAGVAYATINYSLLDVPGFNDATTNDTDGIMKSLSDVKEALQYLRLNAADFNVDPDNIAMYGVSAGASSSLWLALSDDMADVNADAGSLAGVSTRIAAAGAVETQGSMDAVRWEQILSPLGVTLESSAPFLLTLMESVFAIPSSGDDGTISIARVRETTGDIAELRAELDFPALMDATDPAIYVQNTLETGVALTADFTTLGTAQATAPGLQAAFELAASENRLDDAAALVVQLTALGAGAAAAGPRVVSGLLHFPTHATILYSTGLGVGMTVEANIPETGIEIETTPDQTVVTFLLGELIP